MPGRSLNTQTGPEGFLGDVTLELDLEGISIDPRVWRCGQRSWGWGLGRAGAWAGLGHTRVSRGWGVWKFLAGS